MTFAEVSKIIFCGVVLFILLMAVWMLFAHPLLSFGLILLALIMAGHQGGGVPYR
jgi:hypothetical protein